MEWIDFKDKKVFLEVDTVNGPRNYTGIVNEVIYMGKGIDGAAIYFIEITDKFDKMVGISSTAIKIIQEDR